MLIGRSGWIIRQCIIIFYIYIGCIVHAVNGTQSSDLGLFHAEAWPSQPTR